MFFFGREVVLRTVQTVRSFPCSGLADLDGIGALQSLTELRAPNNEVTLCSPLVMCSNIKVLDLSSNRIADPKQLEYNPRNAAPLTFRRPAEDGIRHPTTRPRGYADAREPRRDPLAEATHQRTILGDEIIADRARAPPLSLSVDDVFACSIQCTAKRASHRAVRKRLCMYASRQFWAGTGVVRAREFAGIGCRGSL